MNASFGAQAKCDVGICATVGSTARLGLRHAESLGFDVASVEISPIGLNSTYDVDETLRLLTTADVGIWGWWNHASLALSTGSDLHTPSISGSGLLRLSGKSLYQDFRWWLRSMQAIMLATGASGSIHVSNPHYTDLLAIIAGISAPFYSLKGTLLEDQSNIIKGSRAINISPYTRSAESS
ncbi:hypothetical protein BJ508DRAFT_313882 [Ascobolus immersus RN42]|uniref:Uncharacterized protein n=1 Tax=Ascobolus immersus RN42 TaxID=1160509 RepID=A0A3N4HH15_ASCIM|nr:hypothetical protein BJ508DRAFT_313882 [Ascobolus immersus RN42]